MNMQTLWGTSKKEFASERLTWKILSAALGYEVGYYTFDYSTKDELIVLNHIVFIKNKKVVRDQQCHL
jgi:hypothetical protein